MTFLKKIMVAIFSLFPARFSALSILMYHSISDSGAFFSVSPRLFEQQMKYIRNSKFASVFASEIPERIRKRELARTVCVTFDDGYEDVFISAYPILKTFGIKATIFLITNEIGGSYTNSEGRKFPLLNRKQIEEMRASGFVEFMPHGHTHRKLHQLNETEQKQEIISSRDIVKDIIGSDPTVFAYPRGRMTGKIAEILGHLGFKIALGVMSGLVRFDSDKYNLPRNAVDKNVRFQEFKLKLSDRVEWISSITRLFR